MLVIVSGILFSTLDAQVVPRKGAAAGHKPVNTEKHAIPAARLAAIQQAIRNRKSQSLVAGDPCESSTTITVGTPVDGTLQSGDCQNPDDTLVDFYDFQGTSGQAIAITLTSNSFDTYLYLFDDLGNVIDENDDSGNDTNSRLPIDGGVFTLPYAGVYFIAANSYDPSIGSYTLRVDTPAACAPVSIAYNQTVNSTFATSDCEVNIGDEPYYTHLYQFNGTSGQQITISQNSPDVDPYLILHTPSGEGSLSDDDSGGGLNSRIPASGTFTLAETGIYVIEASTAHAFEVGAFTLILTGPNVATGTKVFADFDGDSRSDISVWRPLDGNWYVMNSSNSTFSSVHFGTSGDQIVPGDYDGDGKTDFAVFRSGTWYVLASTAGFSSTQFGLPTDLPAQGDFDGDGKTDVVVFRPSNGTWYVHASTAGFSSTPFGTSGDKPAVGDYDGDGRSDIAVYRPSDGNWYQLRTTAGYAGVHFGISTDKVVPADYDGDGKTDLAVYRDGSPGNWYLMESTAGFVQVAFGTTGDIPVPGDFDGDGKADVSVFRPSDGTWYLQRSTSGFAAQQFGVGSDKPVEAFYVPTQ